MKKIKLKFLSDAFYNGQLVHEKNSVHELESDYGNRWVRRGIAIEVEEVKIEKKPEPVKEEIKVEIKEEIKEEVKEEIVELVKEEKPKTKSKKNKEE